MKAEGAKGAPILLIVFFAAFVCIVPHAYGLDGCTTARDANPSLELVDTVILDKNPEGIAVNEETNLVYVGVDGGVLVMDGETNEVVTEVSLDLRVLVLAVNPQTNRIYAGGDSVVKVIDGATNSVVGEISESISSNEMAVNPVTNRIYIADESWTQGWPDYVEVYDGRTLELVTSVEIPGSRGPFYVQSVGVAVNPNTNRIYATWTYNDNVYVIDGNTHEIIQNVEPSSYSTKIMVNPTTNCIYVGDVVLDGETLEEVVSEYQGYSLGAINPTGNLLYTTSLDDLHVLDGNTHETGPSLELDDIIEDLAVNPKTGKIYATHWSAKKISVVQGPLSLRPANFVISGLTIEPERIDVGKTFTVTVGVSNTGDLTGTHNVELEFAGEVVRNRTATLSGGGSTRITFELLSFEIPEEPGTYTVKVNGQTGTVTVQSPALTIEGYAIIVVMVVGVAVVVVVVFLVLRRRATRRPPTYPFPSY